MSDSRRERRDERSSRDAEHENPATDQTRRVSLHRAHAQALTRRRRLEHSLKISIRPLTQRALLFHDALRLECLAQIGHDALPLRIREPAIELNCLRDAKRKTKELARRLLGRLESLRRLLNQLRRDSNFAANRLKLRERQPATRRKQPVIGILCFGRILQDRGDFLLAEPAVAHCIRRKAVGVKPILIDSPWEIASRNFSNVPPVLPKGREPPSTSLLR